MIPTHELRREGLSYLNRLCRNKEVHAQLITLLKGACKDKRFVDDSKVFGINLIGEGVKTK